LITETNEIITYIKNKLKINITSLLIKMLVKIVGINIIKTKLGFKINQIDYIEKLISNYIKWVKGKQLISPVNLFLKKKDKTQKKVDETKYKSLIGVLYYISTENKTWHSICRQSNR